MKKGKRRNYRSDFQAKICLEALREIKTISQIAAENKIHPNMVTKWKKRGLEGLVSIFETGTSNSHNTVSTEQQDELLRQIGRLTVENEFLKKNSLQ